MTDSKKILAFDIGGTKIAYALIDEKGKICGEWRKVKVAGHAQAVLEHLQNL